MGGKRLVHERYFEDRDSAERYARGYNSSNDELKKAGYRPRTASVRKVPGGVTHQSTPKRGTGIKKSHSDERHHSRRRSFWSFLHAEG